MLRKTVVVLIAIAVVGLLWSNVASANCGFGGHRGGFHGAFNGGGLHGHGLAFEFGLYTPYALHGAYGYPNAYSDGDNEDKLYDVVERRVHTRHGWRLRRLRLRCAADGSSRGRRREQGAARSVTLTGARRCQRRFPHYRTGCRS